MKLYEKMAIDYYKDEFGVDVPNFPGLYAPAFVAGFKAAREMAAAFATKKSTGDGNMCDPDLFLELGEEKV